VIELIYWISLGILTYTWFLYGAALWLVVRLRPRKGAPPLCDTTPHVSVIVAARNEERFLRSRIENLRSLRYDPEKIQVLIASDGSTDGTVAIAVELQRSWDRVEVLDYPTQRGRAAVHNDAARLASGDLLLFTDAETRFEEDFLQWVLPHFRDPAVGAVSGRIIYLNEDDSSVTLSAGLYWRLEERLRRWESDLGILAFGTGAALCMRKELYTPMKNPYDDVDYSETLSLVGRGYEVRYAPRALAYDTISPSAAVAHRVRLRRTSMAFRSILEGIFASRLWRRPGILWSAVSHKLLRHLTPFFMISFAASNFLLYETGPWYRVSLLLQTAFYSAALLGGMAHRWGWKPKALALPFNFVILNFSRMLGIVEGLSRRPPSTYR